MKSNIRESVTNKLFSPARTSFYSTLPYSHICSFQVKQALITPDAIVKNLHAVFRLPIGNVVELIKYLDLVSTRQLLYN